MAAILAAAVTAHVVGIHEEFVARAMHANVCPDERGV